MFKRRLLITLIFVLVCSLVFAGCSSNNKTEPEKGNVANEEPEKKLDYPVRQIEYVVPAGAGGGTDRVARAVAEYVSKEFGQPILVVNKTGGGNVIGCEYALKQGKPDGYTVLADIQSSTSMMVAGMADSPIKLEDRAFISRIIQDPTCFSVKADAPWKDFSEFVEWVKENPEELTWTSIGPSGISAFAVAEFCNAIGVDFNKTRMVATSGAAESLPLVAGGNAVLATHTVAESLTLANAGKIRILAVSAPERSPYAPDVPTCAEQGVEGLTVKWWTGVTAPVGTPAEIVEMWDNVIAKMVKDHAFIEIAKNMNVNVSYMNSAEFEKYVKEEAEHYTKMAVELGIRK
jgi:tripartite-type tricarboxylate transporter receptor subunit TctC